jgi:choline dehydrogenase-like flavoprotein
LLLRSSETGIANRSDAVGRHFMNHNTSAVLAIDPRSVNDSIYQKTIGINDFYLDDGHGGPPLGNIQLLGRVTAPILKANMPRAPEWALGLMSRHSVDWYAMSEDLPNAESRVTVDAAQIRLDWKRSNWTTHLALVAALKERLRAAGYPIVLSKPFDRRTPSHQCGTVRIGLDPATSPLDPFCRAYDHPNLFVVDASFLPTSAAVNPSLTIAAQALRVADHVAKADL